LCGERPGEPRTEGRCNEGAGNPKRQELELGESEATRSARAGGDVPLAVSNPRGRGGRPGGRGHVSGAVART